MLHALRARRVEKLPAQVVLKGRLLFLTEDAGLVRRQLEGQDLDWRPGITLRDNISTPEIPPPYTCCYYGATPGDFPMLSLKLGWALTIAPACVEYDGGQRTNIVQYAV